MSAAKRSVEAEAFSGRRFGRLIALELLRVNGRRHYRCACDCGAEKIVSASHLKHGRVVSCGCYSREQSRNRGRAQLTKHGHRAARTPTYYTWQSMHSRCYRPSNPNFHSYGGRGISVCDRWHVFEHFLQDMGERPPGCTLDRFPDQNGDYRPDNCRWATAKQQGRNTRQNRYIEAFGEQLTVVEWAERTGLSHQCLLNRISAGWAPERIVSTPSARQK